MTRQLAHVGWSLGDNDPKAAALTGLRLFAEWADQTILVIATHFAAPARSFATAQRSGLRSEGGKTRRNRKICVRPCRCSHGPVTFPG
jgi:hypothetical protein